MAKSQDVGTGSRATMGTSASVLANVAKPQRGRSVQKGHSKGGSAYPEGTKGNRKNKLERMGASLHPTINHVSQNSPEASSMGRNVTVMPSRGSYTDNFRSHAGQR